MKHISKVLVLLAAALILYAEEQAQECSVPDDCRHINGSICTGGNCTCPEFTPILVEVKEQNTSFCLTALNVTEGNCTFHQQCNYENGQCLENGKCGCAAKFVVDEGKCEPHVKSSIIPIAVGVVIGASVFATLCIYLWLSRKKE